MAMARCCWCGARQNDLVSTPAGEYSNELKPGLRPRCPVSVYLPIFIRHFFVEGTVVLQRYLTLLPQWRIKINTRGTSGQKNHRKNQIRSSAFFRHFRHFLILSLKLRRPSVGGWPPLNTYACHKAPRSCCIRPRPHAHNRAPVFHLLLCSFIAHPLLFANHTVLHTDSNDASTTQIKLSLAPQPPAPGASRSNADSLTIPPYSTIPLPAEYAQGRTLTQENATVFARQTPAAGLLGRRRSE